MGPTMLSVYIAQFCLFWLVSAQDYVSVKFYQLSQSKWEDKKSAEFQNYVSEKLLDYCQAQSDLCGLSTIRSDLALTRDDVGFSGVYESDNYGLIIQTRVTYNGEYVSASGLTAFITSDRKLINDEIGYSIIGIGDEVYHPEPNAQLNVIIIVIFGVLFVILVIILIVCVHYAEKRTHQLAKKKVNQEVFVNNKKAGRKSHPSATTYELETKKLYSRNHTKVVPPVEPAVIAEDKASTKDLLKAPMQGLNYFRMPEGNMNHAAEYKEEEPRAAEDAEEETDFQQKKKNKKNKKKKKRHRHNSSESNEYDGQAESH